MQNYPGVNRVTRRLADGSVRVYHYHRASGRRLEGEPGSREFALSYAAAEVAAKAPPAPPRRKSFAELMDDFIASPEHQACAARTRYLREHILASAKRRFDWVLVDDLNGRGIRTEIFQWRDEMKATPRMADVSVETVARVLAWAYDRGTIEVNHGARIGRIGPSGRTRADKIWTPALEAQLLEAATPEFAHLFRFARSCAAREADIARLSGRARLADAAGWIGFVPEKTARATGVAVWLPVFELPPFAALIEELDAAASARRWTHGLRSETGKQWTGTNIRSQLAATKARAGLAGVDLTFHDIRGTTTTDLLEAGCTEAEVAAVTGWAIGGGQTKLPSYAARSRTYAINAFRKWAAMLSGAHKVIPFKVVG
jgi:integrase